uniref:Uncharacterized protein n=1 Tax=Rhizoctonia solani TaxID=456999 RepID=N0A713_9AGAM|nr:hypothetical protein RSOL_m01130 [Rhizoctonia solani]AGK45427.1 hypothetical protein RSOL_m01130 [Rhizoctonia solani]
MPFHFKWKGWIPKGSNLSIERLRDITSFFILQGKMKKCQIVFVKNICLPASVSPSLKWGTYRIRTVFYFITWNKKTFLNSKKSYSWKLLLAAS